MSEIQIFFLQLETTLAAGISLSKALHIIANQLSGEFKAKIKNMINSIEEGSTFADAMAKAGSPFSQFQINLIKFGEEAGCLDKVCRSLADHAEKGTHLSRNVFGAMIYPGIVFGVALILGPVIQGIVEPDRAVSAFFQAFFNLIIYFGFLQGMYWFYKSIVSGRISLNLLKVPIVGPIIWNLALSRFSRALSVGLDAGIPLTQCMKIAIEVCGNPWLADRLKDLPQFVKDGRSVAGGFKMAGCFPNMLNEMVLVGEESGKLPEMLEKAACHFDEEASHNIDLIMKLLPTLVFILVALYVGFLLLTMGGALFVGRLNPR